MARVRKTWTDKRAAEAPAMPAEDGGHPAASPDKDPGPKGDTKSWAEEQTPQTGEDGPAPQLPTESANHPADKAAADRRRFAAAERKASHAIRLAEAVLGKGASVPMIEDQATDFMNMETSQILSSLERLSEHQPTAGGFFAEEPADDEFALDDEEEAMLAEMLAVDSKEADEDEVLLAQMLAEEGMSDVGHLAGDDAEGANDEGKEAGAVEATDEKSAADDRIAALEAQIAALTEAIKNPTPAPVAAEVEATETAEACGEEAPMGMEEPEPASDFDPMGMMDSEEAMDDDLASLYSGYRAAGKKSDDDESDDDDGDDDDKEEPKEDEGSDDGDDGDSDDDKEAKKKASESKQRPQPRKASTGVKSVGQVTKAASDSNEIAKLSSLWASAPDVSDHF